ncbi:hypothetical protein [Propioniciclava soli]|uniref:Uncharacterized protein n=1 Tax=Propioniciclava soli TaxID=2775081 RepID=A0ABZ3C370_9ACTN|nr:hypothetical protein [Propioniciclava soli]
MTDNDTSTPKQFALASAVYLCCGLLVTLVGLMVARDLRSALLGGVPLCAAAVAVLTQAARTRAGPRTPSAWPSIAVFALALIAGLGGLALLP